MISYKFCPHLFLRVLVLEVVGLVVFGGILVQARSINLQATAPKKSEEPVTPQQDQDPLKRPRTQKQEQAAQREKLSKPDRDFLNAVAPIISDEELQAFKKLGTNAERYQFMEDFWFHRNPHPESDINEFKEEYFRRVAYANERFSAGMPGSRTDRGRIYIIHGKPDSIDSHPAGGPYQRTAVEGGGSTQVFPFEIWRYRNLDGIGQEVEIEFVDTCGCGAYHISIDPLDKDVMKNIPNTAPTYAESLGRYTKADLLNGREQSLFGMNETQKKFDLIARDVLLRGQPPAPVRGLELNTRVGHDVRYHYLPFDVRVDFLKDAGTVLMPVTIQVPLRELTFVNENGVQRGTVSISGQLRTLSGRPVQSFEDTVHKDIPASSLGRELNNVALYWKALPMRPGRYRLDILLKDMNSDKAGVFSQSFIVPDYAEQVLATSSLILADLIEPLPRQEVGAGSFAIGSDRVRPRVPPSDGKPAIFKQEQKLNLWMQVYNLGLDGQTSRPSATVRYEIVDTGTGQSVVDFTQSTQEMGSVGGEVTLEKSLPLSMLAPGNYQLTVRVDDLVSRQTISPTAKFTVQ